MKSFTDLFDGAASCLDKLPVRNACARNCINLAVNVLKQRRIFRHNRQRYQRKSILLPNQRALYHFSSSIAAAANANCSAAFKAAPRQNLDREFLLCIIYSAKFFERLRTLIFLRLTTCAVSAEFLKRPFATRRIKLPPSPREFKPQKIF